MLSVSVCHFLRRFGSAVEMLAGAAGGGGAGTYRGTINDVAL